MMVLTPPIPKLQLNCQKPEMPADSVRHSYEAGGGGLGEVAVGADQEELL